MDLSLYKEYQKASFVVEFLFFLFNNIIVVSLYYDTRRFFLYSYLESIPYRASHQAWAQTVVPYLTSLPNPRF